MTPGKVLPSEYWLGGSSTLMQHHMRFSKQASVMLLDRFRVPQCLEQFEAVALHLSAKFMEECRKRIVDVFRRESVSAEFGQQIGNVVGRTNFSSGEAAHHFRLEAANLNASPRVPVEIREVQMQSAWGSQVTTLPLRRVLAVATGPAQREDVIRNLEMLVHVGANRRR